mgnify:CR=1 FL=1
MFNSGKATFKLQNFLKTKDPSFESFRNSNRFKFDNTGMTSNPMISSISSRSTSPAIVDSISFRAQEIKDLPEGDFAKLTLDEQLEVKRKAWESVKDLDELNAENLKDGLKIGQEI